MTAQKVTHYCSRCKEHCPLDEWTYEPEKNRWRHTRQLYGATDADGNPTDMECGWTEKVPNKVG